MNDDSQRLATAGERVAHALQAIEAARKARAETARLAQDAFYAQTGPHQLLLNNLVERFRERAIELAEDEAPVSRFRVALSPTEVTATAEVSSSTWTWIPQTPPWPTQ